MEPFLAIVAANPIFIKTFLVANRTDTIIFIFSLLVFRKVLVLRKGDIVATRHLIVSLRRNVKGRLMVRLEASTYHRVLFVSVSISLLRFR